MADQIKQMAAGHSIEVLDAIMTEVEEARGEHDNLGERLDEMSSDTPSPSTAAPAMDGTAAAGTSTDYARADHIHPSDTSKQDALTTAQLAAANSGIDSTKVEQIETNKNNISLLETKTNTNTAILSQTYNSADCIFSVYLVPDNGSGAESTTHYTANDGKAIFVIKWKKNQYKYYKDNVEHYKYRIDSMGLIATNNVAKKDELTLYIPSVTNETYVRTSSDADEQGKTTGTFTWKKSSSNVGDIWYIRPHVEYTDLETGMEYTMYGSVYKVTVGTPCTIECDTLSCTELTAAIRAIQALLASQ